MGNDCFYFLSIESIIIHDFEIFMHFLNGEIFSDDVFFLRKKREIRRGKLSLCECPRGSWKLAWRVWASNRKRRDAVFRHQRRNTLSLCTMLACWEHFLGARTTRKCPHGKRQREREREKERSQNNYIASSRSDDCASSKKKNNNFCLTILSLGISQTIFQTSRILKFQRGCQNSSKLRDFYPFFISFRLIGQCVFQSWVGKDEKKTFAQGCSVTMALGIYQKTRFLFVSAFLMNLSFFLSYIS